MKITKPKLLLVLALFLCLIVRAAAADEGTDLERRIRLHTLKNGIKLLMLERHISPTVSFYIRHRTGAVDEPDGKTGMAHFLEHMMFKGTTTIGTKDYSREKPILDRIAEAGRRLDAERRKGKSADADLIAKLVEEIAALQKQAGQWMVSNEMDRLYTENGGLDMNGSTGQDIMTFQVSLPANKMELWARIEADRMTNPVLREFYTERDVIREEKRQRTDSSPDGRLMEQFLAEAFTTHPYRRPVVGRAADIPFLGMDDMESFIGSFMRLRTRSSPSWGTSRPTKPSVWSKRISDRSPHIDTSRWPSRRSPSRKKSGALRWTTTPTPGLSSAGTSRRCRPSTTTSWTSSKRFSVTAAPPASIRS